MTKSSRIISRSLLLIATLALAQPGFAQAPLGPPMPLNDTAFGDSGGDQRPFIATDGADRWIALWYSTEDVGGSIGTDFDILYSISADDGDSWSSAAPIHSTAMSDSGRDLLPRVATDGNGVWIAVWYSDENLGNAIGTDHDVFYSVSTDDGDTWSGYVALNTNADVDSGDDINVVITTDGEGTWIAAWHSREEFSNTLGPDADILYAVSTNNGTSWTDPAILNTNAATDMGDDFAIQIVTDGAGNWMAGWFSTEDLNGELGTDQDNLFATSTNNGTTWSDPAPINSNAAGENANDFQVRIATDGQGTWMAVWPSFNDNGGLLGQDSDIFYSISEDFGANWSELAYLNSTAPFDITFESGDGSPQIATDKAGNWICVWEARAFDGDDDDIFMSLSEDKGATWSDPFPVNTTGSSDSGHDYYAEIATDGDGTWIVIWNSDDDLEGTIGTDTDVLFTKVRPSDPTDVNGDGTVNSQDIQSVINAVLAGGADTSADVNGDGSVNSQDIQLVINQVLGV